MRKLNLFLALASGIALILGVAFQAESQTTSKDPVIDGFSKVAIASVSDAVDQVVGHDGIARAVTNIALAEQVPYRVLPLVRAAAASSESGRAGSSAAGSGGSAGAGP